jgi:SAM-dependent methyltransferase
MIALKDNTFRNTYKNIQAPTETEITTKNNTITESHNLNNAILEAITRQLVTKINNLSKEYSWKDKFSFIKNIDYSLLEYIEIIDRIEKNIFQPFQNDEKQDVLGRAYKIFLSRAGKIDNKNIILTPDHVKNLMIGLARLNVNDVVLDTCTGTGGFLMEAMEVLIKKAEGDNKLIQKIKEKQLIGFETDSVLFALACSNMFLHGDGRTNLIFRSSLLNDKNENIINNKETDLLSYIRSLKPTKCIINPPYENNNSIKFTKQALDYLEPNGKLIIIMPTPTLTQNQNGYTEEILKIAKLDFVIKMPNKLFSEQKRTVNTSIFGFTKTPHNKSDDVIFYNLEDDGYVSIQHKGRVDKFNKWFDIKNILIESITNSKEKTGVCEKRKIYKDNILNCAGVQKTYNKNSKMVKIEEIFDIKLGSLASENSEEGEYDFITGSEDWKQHSEYDYDTEALVYVISAAGSLGRSHYVNGKFIASNLCLVLTPKADSKYPVNLKFYNTYFSYMRKKMVSDLADGTSKLTINKETFKNYYIDYIDIEKQNEFANSFIGPFREKIIKLKNETKIAEDNIDSKLSKIF